MGPFVAQTEAQRFREGAEFELRKTPRFPVAQSFWGPCLNLEVPTHTVPTARR